MNKFIEDLEESLSNSYYINILNQYDARQMLKKDRNDFPMICFEYTEESKFEVSFNESKFLNDPVHDGYWITGSNDECIEFTLCLQLLKNCIEINIFEINKNLRCQNIGKEVLSIIESCAKKYFGLSRVSPFDNNAICFWEHMKYSECSDGYWRKML